MSPDITHADHSDAARVVRASGEGAAVTHKSARKGRRPGRAKNATHPRVKLLPPNAKNGWRGRFKDPTTGRVVSHSLRDHVIAGNREATLANLREWAKAKDLDLANAAHAHQLGRSRPAAMGVSDATNAFLESGGKRGKFSASTARTYRDTLNHFERHLDALGVKHTRDVTLAHVSSFAEARKRAAKLRSKKGGRIGEMVEAGERSPHSVNKELRAVRAFLRWARKGHAVQLTRDDIADAVNTLQAPVRRRAFLKPDEIRQLLRACEAHDAATFAETREEHRGKRSRGTTPKHKRITPLVRCLLLTGLRIGEALQIRWRDVQGDELHVSADISKTREDRVVDLSVAPTAMPKRPKCAPDTAFVFQLSRGEIRAACRRTQDAPFNAPTWSPHALRRTAATFFTCTFGAWRSAAALGHSVVVSERHYAGLTKVPARCKNLETAMGLSARGAPSSPRGSARSRRTSAQTPAPQPPLAR